MADSYTTLFFLVIGAWLSLVERYVRDVEVAGSNPVAPTILTTPTEALTQVTFCLLRVATRFGQDYLSV